MALEIASHKTLLPRLKMFACAALLILLLAISIPPPFANGAGAEESLKKPQSIERVLDENMPSLRSRVRMVRERALQKMHDELALAANSRSEPPDQELKKRYSRELIRLYSQSTDKDFSHPTIRRQILHDLTRFGDNANAKHFVLQKLERGTAEERSEIVGVLGSAGGISGLDVFEKVNALGKAGILDPESRTTLLARIDKERALPEVINELTSTSNPRRFLYSAWALQDYYKRPEHFRLILPGILKHKLAERGSFNGTKNGLFWINPVLLATFLEGSGSSDSTAVLGLMVRHSPLIRPTSVPAIAGKLEDPDTHVRVLAAEALEVAAAHPRSDKELIRRSLQSALSREQSREVKKALTDTLGRIDRQEALWRRTLEKGD